MPEKHAVREGGQGAVSQRARRLTIIVVPPTGRRSYSLNLYPALLGAGALLVALVIAALSLGVWYFQGEVKRLQAEVGELEQLRQQARLQQAEIEQMKQAAERVELELMQIRQLERDLDAMTEGGPTPPSRSSQGRTAVTPSTARGGPDVSETQSRLGLTLGAVLPGDVAPYIIGRRDTLALDLKLVRLPQAADRTLATARQTSSTMQLQLEALQRSTQSLIDGREQLAARLEYLAHRPTGWPVDGAEITDEYGPRWSPFGGGYQFHDGIDLGQDYGAPIYATGAGTVVYADWLAGGYGKCVIIDHGYGYRTLYGHLQDWNVTVGQEVVRGDLIGWVGSTGLSTGPHVHYEVQLNGVAVDPAPYLN